MLAEKLSPLRGRTDLIVLPEMFTTGFSMRPEGLAEPMDGPTVEWMREQAQDLGAALTGSFICGEGGRYYNRLIFMFPDGYCAQYDKKHCFTLAGEHEHYTPGREHLLVEWQGFRIRPLICYDLRFPVWSRNAPDHSYDLLLYVANWPARRAAHWQNLLTARAIENQAYTVGVNIVGTDGNGLEYRGDSSLTDYAGEKIGELSLLEGVFTSKLSLENLQKYRQNLPFLADSDPFQLA